MSTKQKLLDAMGITLDDLDEARLIDILVDMYKSKTERILQLEAENAHEREVLRSHQNALQQEYHRLRSDPVASVYGEYYFGNRDGRRICVSVQGGKLQVVERDRASRVDFIAQPMTREEWNS